MSKHFKIFTSFSIHPYVRWQTTYCALLIWSTILHAGAAFAGISVHVNLQAVPSSPCPQLLACRGIRDWIVPSSVYFIGGKAEMQR